LLAGDTSHCQTLDKWQKCFNPRPPLLAGDTAVHTLHTRLAPLFQSAPAIAGGRYRFMCTPLVLPGFSLQMRVPAKSAYADAAIHR